MPNVLLAIIFAIAGLIGTSIEWQSVEAEECGFAISMPAQPEVMADTTRAPVGPIITLNYVAIDEADSYNVGCSTFPATFFAVVDKAEFLDGGVERFVGGTGGELISRQEVEVEGHPGRRYAVKVAEAVIYNEVYVVGRRVYQLSVSRWEEVDFDEDEGLKRFFGSFELRQ